MAEAPRLDPRSLDEIVAHTEALASAYSPWRPQAGDLGGVLIRLFGHMVAHLIERMNQLPTKHQLAFTNLLGVKRIGPRPARVPVTYTLSPGEGTAEIPEGALVAATTPEGSVTFETESPIVLTRSLLKAVIVRDIAARAPNGTPASVPEDQRYAVRTRNATGEVATAFDAFAATQPRDPNDDPDNLAIEHELYLAIRDPDEQRGASEVRVNVAPKAGTPPDIAWSAWDGTGWSPLPGSSVAVGVLEPRTVGDQLAHWLRGVVKNPDETMRIGLDATFKVNATQKAAPDVGFCNAQKLDLSRDFYPFGDHPRTGDAFYFSCDEAFGLDNVTVELVITLATKPTGQDTLTLAWESWSKDGWKDLGTDTTSGLTAEPTKLTFTLGTHIDRAKINEIEGRWIRVRIKTGNYGHDVRVKSDDTKTIEASNLAPPVIGSLTVSWKADAVPAKAAILRLTAGELVRQDGPELQPYSLPEHGSTPFDPKTALYLGFDAPFEPHRTTLYVEVAPPLAAPPLDFNDTPTTAVPPVVLWEYWNNGWVRLDVDDGTQGFARAGLVRFDAPASMAALKLGVPLYWLRARPASMGFAPMPQLHRISTNTVFAAQQRTTTLETLGSSNGSRDQTFTISSTPVLEGQHVEVAEPQSPSLAELTTLDGEEGEHVVTTETNDRGTRYWVRWHEVPDFWASGPRDRHYTFDPMKGVVVFGDGVTGMIPPIGTQNVRAARYRAGGGPAGNLAAGLITQLKTSVAGVESVTNHEQAVGGAPIESEPAMMARASRTLRHGYRAATAQDFADLALEASKAVARAVALTPAFSPIDQAAKALTQPPDLFRDGEVIVVIVPAQATTGRSPSVELLTEVHDYLRARCAPAVKLRVIGPSWVAAKIVLEVAATNANEIDAVRARVREAIFRCLDPVTGGEGSGWELGRRPRSSDLIACAMAVPGVDHAYVLENKCAPPFDVEDTDANTEIGIDALSMFNRLLVFADSVTVEAA